MTNDVPSPCFRATGPVFISYTHKDGKPVVDFVEAYLRAGGIIPWRDQRDLGDGHVESTIREAMADGLSGGILVVTEQIADSDFVPDIEIPALLQLKDVAPDRCVFQIINTVRDPKTGALDANAPDALLGAKLADGQRLNDIKQYALLAETPDGQAASSDMQLLLTDLLRRRLRARGPELEDHEITIGVQTRPEVNAAEADSRAGKNNDLTIRLMTDRQDAIPSELSYRCLQQALPRMIDAIYDAKVPRVRFAGGCHPSLAWALGAALPEARPRLERFVWADTRAKLEWSSEASVQAVQSRIECHRINAASKKKLPSELVKAPGEVPSLAELEGLLPDGLDNIVVLLAAREEYQTRPLVELAERLGHAAIVVVKVSGPDPRGWVPPKEGEAVAYQLGTVLRRLASMGKLHLAMSAPVGLVALTARHCNTLSIDIYERDVDVARDVDRYVRVFRGVSGHSRPVARVFPQGTTARNVQRLVNLTPHDVTLYAGEESVRELDDRQLRRWPRPQHSREWVRRTEHVEDLPSLSIGDVEVPVTQIHQGELSHVPDPEPGVGYIVPRISAAFARRPDFFFPHREVRDQEGSIIGCLGLGCFPAVSDSARPYLQYLDPIGEE